MNNKLKVRGQILHTLSVTTEWNGLCNSVSLLCDMWSMYVKCQCRGGSRIFFRRGCTPLLLYFNTNKPHSFFCRIPVVLENRRSPQGEGVRTPSTLPLDPPLQWLRSNRELTRIFKKHKNVGKTIKGCNCLASFLVLTIPRSVVRYKNGSNWNLLFERTSADKFNQK